MSTFSAVELLGVASDFVAAVAVVISLFYVAKQLRLNTNALKANAAWDSEVAYGNANIGWAQDRDSSQLSARMMRSDAKNRRL